MLARTGVILGAVLGVYGIAAVVAIVSLLPPGFGLLIPIGGLLIPVMALWPTRFDRAGDAPWWLRLGQRMGAVLIAAVVSGAVSFLLVLAIPAYTTWSDNVHRESLKRRGLPDAEIESQVLTHRQTPLHHSRDALFFATAPGTIAALITTVAGGILSRRRRAP